MLGAGRRFAWQPWFHGLLPSASPLPGQVPPLRVQCWETVRRILVYQVVWLSLSGDSPSAVCVGAHTTSATATTGSPGLYSLNYQHLQLKCEVSA